MLGVYIAGAQWLALKELGDCPWKVPRSLFTRLSVEPFLAKLGTIPMEWKKSLKP